MYIVILYHHTNPGKRNTELTCILAALHRGSIRSGDLSSFWSFSTLDDNELHTFTITYTPKILFGIIFYDCCLQRQMNPVKNSSVYYYVTLSHLVYKNVFTVIIPTFAEQ